MRPRRVRGLRRERRGGHRHVPQDEDREADGDRRQRHGRDPEQAVAVLHADGEVDGLEDAVHGHGRAGRRAHQLHRGQARVAAGVPGRRARAARRGHAAAGAAGHLAQRQPAGPGRGGGRRRRGRREGRQVQPGDGAVSVFPASSSSSFSANSTACFPRWRHTCRWNFKTCAVPVAARMTKCEIKNSKQLTCRSLTTHPHDLKVNGRLIVGSPFRRVRVAK